MRLSVYYSKLFSALSLLFACGFAAVFLSIDKMPLFPRIIVGLIALAIAIGSLKSLISGKPVISADDDGLRDHRYGKTVIRWQDILAFRHSPRTEKSANGQTSFTLFEGWRPIQLWIHAPEKNLFTSLHRMKRSPKHPSFPDALYLEIDFTGMDTPSSRLAEFIRENAAGADEMKA